MKANTFDQAVQCYASHMYDNHEITLNEFSYPHREDSVEKKTVWVLKNSWGTLCAVHKITGKIL